jgi:hypothetical protein
MAAPCCLKKHCPVAARAGADGGLCGGLRLRTRGRLSRSWRGVLGNLGGKDGLHDRGSGWFGRARKEGVFVAGDRMTGNEWMGERARDFM